MMKLRLENLAVETFATVEMPRQMSGTVQGRQMTYGPEPTCYEANTCVHTCQLTCPLTCEASCRDTNCVAACQGQGQLTKECVQTE